MQTKLSKLVAMMQAEQWDAAIKFAAKFHDLGEEKAHITRAKDALLNPRFYEQLGRNVPDLIQEGQAALLRRYGKCICGHSVGSCSGTSTSTSPHR